MPRIRSVKPGFWQDQRLSRLPSLTRLTFLCLISMADDEGRIEGDAETVQHFGFPREDSKNVLGALKELSRLSRIVLYTSREGQSFIAVVNFKRHQRIDKPKDSELPVPPTDTYDSWKDLGCILDSSRQVSDGLDMDGKGLEREGNGEGGESPRGEQPQTQPQTAPGTGAGVLEVEILKPKPRAKSDPLVSMLRERLGCGIAQAKDQVRALRAAGWDDLRLESAITQHAEPGLAPWDWTKRVRGLSQNGAPASGAAAILEWGRNGGVS